MGVQITEILERKEIDVGELSSKVIAVDAYNHLYQFLTTIRQRDGTPLMDSRGKVTSHLSGLFSRTTNLMEKGISPVYVFDGEPPILKKQEQERRKGLKKEAEEKYRVAVEKKDIDEMRKQAARTSKLTAEMVDESKELCMALGLPVVQAPSEGEAQAALMVRSGSAYAVSSQDTDSLLFGAPLLVRNLSVSGRRKRQGSLAWEQVSPELIGLEGNLKKLGLDQDQLIVLAVLVGTDYNIGGIKGIGPKNALKLLHRHQADFDSLFAEVEWGSHFNVPWKEIVRTFKSMRTTTKYDLAWQDPDRAKVREILAERHDFSFERVESTLARLEEARKKGQQKNLGEFF